MYIKIREKNKFKEAIREIQKKNKIVWKKKNGRVLFKYEQQFTFKLLKKNAVEKVEVINNKKIRVESTSIIKTVENKLFEKKIKINQKLKLIKTIKKS